MIQLRMRGTRYYLWGEHLGVKVQKATGTSCPIEAENLRKEKILEIEEANPTLANAYYIRQEMRKAKAKADVAEPIVYGVGDWRNFNNWTLEDAVQVYTDSPNTSDNARNAIMDCLGGVIHNKLPRKIADMEALIDYWQSRGDKPLANSSIKTYLGRVRGCLNYVEKWSREHRPEAHYRVPMIETPAKEQAREDVYLSPEEAERFLDVVEERWPAKHPIYLLLAYTGVRPVELARLRWDDVYLRNSVEDSLIVVKHKKGKKGGEVWRKRNVPMHPKVYDLLSSFSDRKGAVVKRWGGHYSTKNPKGRSRVPSFCNYPFDKAKKLAQLPDHITCYALRHTFASWLRKKNVPLDAIAVILGHSDIQTTMRYAHLSNDDKAVYVSSIV